MVGAGRNPAVGGAGWDGAARWHTGRGERAPQARVTVERMDDFDQPSDLTVGDLDPSSPVPAGHAVLDVREQDEWDAGHIPGAVHIPLGELPDRLDDLPEEDLLVVCRSGGRSMRATAWLNHSGFTARNLDGGMRSWGAAGLPMTADEGRDPYVL